MTPTGVREVAALLVEESATSWDLLSRARLVCQRGGPVHTGADCLACRRLIDWRPGPAPDRLTIRCRWSDRDPIAAVMTLTGVLVAVDRDAPVGEAVRRSLEADVDHVAVVEGDRVVGVACRRCDLAGAVAEGERVGDRMSHPLVGLGGSATIGQARAAMDELGISWLPLVAGELLVGVVTRGDLRRAGC